jgi:hypothetical protein
MSQAVFSPICVSLDGHAIRALQLRSSDKQPQTQAYAYNAYISNTSPNKLDVGEQLKKLGQLLAEPHWGDFVGNKMFIAVPGLSENEQVKTLAFAHAHELDSQLQAEIVHDDTPKYFTHLPLHQYVDASGRLQQAFLVRAQPAVLHHYLSDILSSHPYDAELVSATASLGNMLLSAGVESAVAIQIGVLTTKIIGINNQIVAVDTIAIGFEHILNSLAKELSQQRKLAYKALIANLDSESNIQQAINKTLQKELSPVTQAIVNIIAANELVDPQLVVLGDGARIPKLGELLAEQTNTRVISFDPWDQVASYPLRPLARNLKPTFSLPLGMALASLN